jgi:hypothetical protein
LVATAQELTFTSALPLAESQGKGALTLVTIKLGQTCWTNQSDPGVLHRCLQGPRAVSPAGESTWCDYGSPGCDDALFEDKAVARGVKEAELFAYYRADSSVMTSPVAKPDLGGIGAVEFRVTVTGQSEGRAIDATVYKYFSINEWRRI